MPNKYYEAFLNRLYQHYYKERWYWKEDIWQIMWTELLEAHRRYKRYAGISRFEEYAEKVITKKVNHWITENGYYYYNYKSLDEPFWDSETPILTTYIASEQDFCPLELFDFTSGLGLIKFIICKEYILRRKDEDIIDRLNMTRERLEEIKSELREDFRKGYLL